MTAATAESHREALNGLLLSKESKGPNKAQLLFPKPFPFLNIYIGTRSAPAFTRRTKNKCLNGMLDEGLPSWRTPTAQGFVIIGILIWINQVGTPQT